MCPFICCLKELVQDGIRFPVVGFDSPSTVTKVLLQQPGKLKAKQLREGEHYHKSLNMNPRGECSGLNLLASCSISYAECCVNFYVFADSTDLLYDL